MSKPQLPLKWHGGKDKLATWHISKMPAPCDYLHCVEAYGGGAARLFYLPLEHIEGHSEVYNDLNFDLTNFFCVLADPALKQQFIDYVSTLPFSEILFDQCLKYLETVDIKNHLDVTRAAAFFIVNRMSRQGLMADFATLSRTRTRRGMNEQVSSWMSAVDGLEEAHARLRQVVITNQHAEKLIASQDGEQTFFYLDPTYLHETRSAKRAYGKYEMSDDDHESLLCVLGNVRGKFMLCGYPSDMYSSFAAKYRWRHETREISNHSSSAKQKEKKPETIWMNY